MRRVIGDKSCLTEAGWTPTKRIASGAPTDPTVFRLAQMGSAAAMTRRIEMCCWNSRVRIAVQVPSITSSLLVTMTHQLPSSVLNTKTAERARVFETSYSTQTAIDLCMLAV
jgi:hypothetical protein